MSEATMLLVRTGDLVEPVRHGADLEALAGLIGCGQVEFYPLSEAMGIPSANGVEAWAVLDENGKAEQVDTPNRPIYAPLGGDGTPSVLFGQRLVEDVIYGDFAVVGIGRETGEICDLPYELAYDVAQGLGPAASGRIERDALICAGPCAASDTWLALDGPSTQYLCRSERSCGNGPEDPGDVEVYHFDFGEEDPDLAWRLGGFLTLGRRPIEQGRFYRLLEHGADALRALFQSPERLDHVRFKVPGGTCERGTRHERSGRHL